MTYYEELGQTYEAYVHGHPTHADERRRTIYIQPLGDFSPAQRQVVNLTAEFLGIYYQLPVQLRDGAPWPLVPQGARREQPQSGTPQILTTYVLDEVLKPRLPDDAVALIGFTASDLWGPGTNFLFGQAQLIDRVAVWSIHRLGDPEKSEDSLHLTLRRSLHIASHETGHAFSMTHCVFFECCMNGANHLEETDRHPLWLCPQCLAKLCFAVNADPEKRFRELIGFAESHDLPQEAHFWKESLARLRQLDP